MSDRTAQEHADTSALAEWVMLEMRDRFGDDFRSNALDALLAEVERLTAELKRAAEFRPLYESAVDRAEAAEALAERRGDALRQYAAEDTCPDCDGDGTIPGGHTCGWCAGTGMVCREDAWDNGVRARAALADGGQDGATT